jgi:molybdenum cofactor cytidylyltransferase
MPQLGSPAWRVVALVMAAGRSRRFGSDKRRACLPDGRNLLQAVVQTQIEACGDVLVLLRSGDAWGQSVCAEAGVACLLVDDADAGLGRTLSAGLQAIMADERVVFDAALVVLADMPAVSPDTVRALMSAFSRDGRAAWPWHAGQPGHPRLLPRSSWPTLLDLVGDEGARARFDWSQATRVEVPDAGILLDIDTPGDLIR